MIKSSSSAPILVPKTGGSAVVLDRIPLSVDKSTADYSESWLQDLLYRFPNALPIDEIDDGFSGLIPVCKEMNTPVGPVDVVYITPSGRPVIVEAKLWRNPEARRKVVGQILDYAQALSRWDFTTFDAAVKSARRAEDNAAAPQGIRDLAAKNNANFDETKFCDAVSRSLRRGEMLLLIVGDGIREGVATITEFIEAHAELHFTFGLVEMAIHTMPDGAHLVQPRVLAQSAIVRRIVVDLQDPKMLAKEEAETSQLSGPAEGEEVNRAAQKFTQFWTRFLDVLELDDRSQPISKPSRSTNQYFMMPPRSTGWVSAFLAQSIHQAGVYLTFYKGTIGDRIYRRLKEDREAIDRALGIKVSWEEGAGKHSIISRVYHLRGDLISDHGAALQTILADWVNRFVNVFKPRIEQILDEETITSLA